VLALGVLALASAISLGPAGIGALEARLSYAATLPVNRVLTLAPIIGSVAVARAVQAAIALWALVLAYRLRRKGPELVIVAALVGGLLASPYLHLDDLVMLGLAAWLYLRTPRPGWTPAFVLAVVIAVEGVALWGPVPVVAGEMASLVLLSVLAWRSASPSDDLHPQERFLPVSLAAPPPPSRPAPAAKHRAPSSDPTNSSAALPPRNATFFASS
jgi:hypothetical protein